MTSKQRLDTLLVARGLVETRARSGLVLAGLVWSEGRCLDKPGISLAAKHIAAAALGHALPTQSARA